MKIIIVGGGKVGETLIANLCSEGHDITVIDRSDKVVDQICDRFDVMGFSGNGASYTILEEADIAHADLVIAVTGHDELNLFVCLLARKAGNCQTIARVHNPEYNRAVNFIKEELGLALVISSRRRRKRPGCSVSRLPLRLIPSRRVRWSFCISGFRRARCWTDWTCIPCMRS